MTDEEIKSFEGSYSRANKVLKKINDYATLAVSRTSKEIDSPEGFSIDNWSHIVAWWGGHRSAMRIVQDLTRTK